MFFVEQLRKFGEKKALVAESGESLSYTELAGKVDGVAQEIGPDKKLLIVETSNEIEPIVAYLAALKGNHAVILVGDGTTAKDSRIFDEFNPYAVFRKDKASNWSFEKNPEYKTQEIHPDLSILLSTSGTTGSAKLVRLSKENIEQNTKSIVSYLELGAEQNVITTLPFHYSYGMSIINTHLASGSTLFLTNRSFAEKPFWDFFASHDVACLYGVPYSFELLEKIKFREKSYPSLEFIAQAGGRLPAALAEIYCDWTKENKKKMFIMYGQTEAAPRISYIPADKLDENLDCIGKAVPNGNLKILDENDQEITSMEEQGELVYQGPNVMMGYAIEKSDLKLGQGTDVLRTGDLACLNENGFFKIVGRQSRFCKIFGLRVSFDEVEKFLERNGYKSIVVGKEELLVIATLDKGESKDILTLISDQYKFPANVIRVFELEEYPLLPSGKIDNMTLLGMANDQEENHIEYENLLSAYKGIMSLDYVEKTDSFLSLGGDSLLYVEISLIIEEFLGYLPDNWEAHTIEELERLKAANDDAETDNISVKKIWAVIGLLAFMLLSGEVLLQIRSYLKTGNSILSLAASEQTFVYRPELGAKTYQPNLKKYNPATDSYRMEINSYGLRSDEIPLEKPNDEYRVAVIGASTVAGTYAASNDETFPAFLNGEMDENFSELGDVHVINAGVEGLTLIETLNLAENLIYKMQPDLAIVYPGFNDISTLCGPKDGKKLQGLSYLALPDWLMSKELIRKNTMMLREQKTSRADTFRNEDLDPSIYRKKIENIVLSIKDAGITPVLMTTARAYMNVDNPEQIVIDSASLFYYNCLEVDTLFYIVEEFNKQVRNVAKEHNIKLIDLAEHMPGGYEYFVDGSHFSLTGEKYAAKTINDALLTFLKEQ